ncbi:MAG: hypothetical protein ACNI23_06935 [Maridesulfovibrio sp.]
MPSDGLRPIDSREQLTYDSSFLHPAPKAAGSPAYIVELSQQTDNFFSEQERPLTLTTAKFRVDFVRATAFLSKEVTRGFIPRIAHRIIPTRAPPFV